MTKEEEYWKFAESEKHFNEIQSGIRNIASGWLLAAFAAIALLLRSDPNGDWLVGRAVLIGVVCFMATLGLLILWINDQLVYQRLLDAGFVIAFKKEYDDPDLPPVRLMMVYATEGKGMSRRMTRFYAIPMWVFLAIAAATTVLRNVIGTAAGCRGDDGWLVTLIVLCAAQLFAAVWVQMAKEKVGARARAEIFGKEFSAMFDDDPEGRARLADAIRGRGRSGAQRGKQPDA